MSKTATFPNLIPHMSLLFDCLESKACTNLFFRATSARVSRLSDFLCSSVKEPCQDGALGRLLLPVAPMLPQKVTKHMNRGFQKAHRRNCLGDHLSSASSLQLENNFLAAITLFPSPEITTELQVLFVCRRCAGEQQKQRCPMLRLSTLTLLLQKNLLWEQLGASSSNGKKERVGGFLICFCLFPLATFKRWCL